MEAFRQLARSITVNDVVCAAGLVLFGIWLLRTSWGSKALADSAPRENSMPLYVPFIPLFVWFVPVSLAIHVARKVTADMPDWQVAAVENVIYCAGGVVVAGGAVVLAKIYFARGLKGFGLKVKTIHRDLAAAAVNLLSVWPLMLATLMLTIRLGKVIWGSDFEMQQHEQLELIGQYPQLSLRILIVVVAVVIAPVLEEILFRGLLQTTIRSFLDRLQYPQSAWLSIAAASALFASSHAIAGHWPALFVLGLCMGYAYEKSGSLFRPIFIHALFNGVTILAVLSG